MPIEPASQGSERDLVSQYLDFQRQTVLLKASGLDRVQMAQVLPTSSLTLAACSTT